MHNDLITQIEADAPEETKTILDFINDALIPQGIEIPKPEAVFSIGNIPLFTKKSISTLIGKAKSGKTTVTAWIVAQLINQGISVAWFDTEQGRYYGSRTQFWVLTIAGKQKSIDLNFYDLKIHGPHMRADIIKAVVENTMPDLVIIDGSRDLVFDINSPEESTLISGEFMKWAEVYNCHIMTILHTNKGDGNARGHLGTELMNKSETVIKVDNDKDNGLIVCSPEFTRSEPFNVFAFDRDDKGIPQVIENFSGDTSVSNNIKKDSLMPNDPNLFDTHIQVITKMFSQAEWLKYSEVIDQIQLYFGEHGIKFGEKKARLFIEYYRNNSYMVHDENQKGHAKWRSGLTQTKGILPNEDF